MRLTANEYLNLHSRSHSHFVFLGYSFWERDRLLPAKKVYFEGIVMVPVCFFQQLVPLQEDFERLLNISEGAQSGHS